VAGFFKRLRTDAQEARSMVQFFETPIEERPIVVYVEDDYSWNQLGGYVEALTLDWGIPVTYITSNPDDPIIEGPPAKVEPIVLTTQLPVAFPKIDSPVTLTTMPDLGQLGIKRPQDTKLFYSFHSLNSIHMSYREGAFDAYDAFFCTGPYQVAELRKHFELIGKEGIELHDVGYSKLDRLRSMVENVGTKERTRPLVVIAPSWGAANILEGYGSETISAVAAMDVDVIIRPHPATFESIYPEGASIVESLEREFAALTNVNFERSITSEESLVDGDILISDWSGVSFEYAFSTERPVVFIDTPRKVKNENWQKLSIAPFEDRMRTEIGEIAAPDDPRGLQSTVERMLENRSYYRDKIVEARHREIFNFGSAASVGAEIIAAELR
jgi:YidC/Oxa1 family membrane protein insertase